MSRAIRESKRIALAAARTFTYREMSQPSAGVVVGSPRVAALARAGIESIAAAESALKQGEAIMVFPEGTFKRMPGLLPFHMGAFSVAVSCNTPVIPIAIRGTRQILRADSWFPRRGHIEIHVDTPVEPESGEAWSVALALRDASRGFILEHNGEPDLSHESNKVERGIT